MQARPDRLTAWRPGGAIAEFFGITASFQPSPPPPGAGNPLDWGRPGYVRQLLGDAFNLEFTRAQSPQLAWFSAAHWQLFITASGPSRRWQSRLSPHAGTSSARRSWRSTIATGHPRRVIAARTLADHRPPEVTAMDKTAINPWTWQDARGFTQAWRVRGADSVLFLSGQGPLDADGHLVGEGDFDAQVRLTFDNLVTVLRQADHTIADIRPAQSSKMPLSARPAGFEPAT